MADCRFLGVAWAALICVVALPSVARAQSAIGGTVKDTSGAVLPGVTVEVASDVLIEKTKTVSTDGEGKYDQAETMGDGSPCTTGSKVWRKGGLVTSATDS